MKDIAQAKLQYECFSYLIVLTRVKLYYALILLD
jgi:hypothetical protein